jgi:hypothetical protein
MTTLRMISNGDVAVVGIHVPDSHVRRPVHVALALDVSGSMEGERLNEVKRTLHAARGLFQEDDHVTLVTFSDGGRLICNHQVMDEAGLATFYTAVDGLATEGSTNMSAAFELLASAQTPADPYSAIILLTDGVVNAGITSISGLRVMANSFRAPIHFLGYGPDHNRILGRDIATARRGTYTYVESNEVLPVAVGNILGGLRTEVVFGAKLHVEGWTCKEVNADDGPYTVGNLEAGRDYWFVYERLNNGVAVPVVELVDRDATVVARLEEVEADDALITEQSLRCRVAAALNAAATAVEAHQPIGNNITALRDEIQGLPDAIRMRPLMLRMLAQLEETIEMAAQMPVYPMMPGLLHRGLPHLNYNHLATRMVSGGTVFGLQRGISGPSHGPELFASPSQALAAQSTSEAYSITDPTQV